MIKELLRNRKALLLTLLGLPAVALLISALQSVFFERVSGERGESLASTCPLPTPAGDVALAEEDLNLFISCGGFFE